MCGRVTLDFTLEQLKEMLEEDFQISNPRIDAADYAPRYNIAPGQPLLNVINDGRDNRAGYMKWGLVPHWAKDPNIGYKMINARSETAAAKPSFKASFESKRCIIIADSFYEWQRKGGQKIPYRITLSHQAYMPFAGLWSTWRSEDGSPLYTCTILTTSANSLIESIHHRMPVILSQEGVGLWLAKNSTPKDLQTLMQPYDAAQMTMYGVSDRVNSAKYDGPDLITPI